MARYPRVFVLTGPTGVGKSRFLYECLAPFTSRVEIISADSAQVYRGMDIGTAKPSAEERATLVHHLIDILDPEDSYSVADFVRETNSLVKEISARGKLALVSGGTAFYIKHLLLGLTQTPPSDPLIRAELEQECRSRGLEAMREELSRLDPAAAGRIAARDRYRVLRALEVIRSSGKLLSDFPMPTQLRQDWDLEAVCMARDRESLGLRIEARVDRMMEEGLADELRSLVEAGYSAGDPGLRAIGYREFFDAEGELLEFDKPARASEIAQQIKIHSRQLAKRQMTFFRSIPGLDIEESDARQDADGSRSFPEVLRRLREWIQLP